MLEVVTTSETISAGNATGSKRARLRVEIDTPPSRASRASEPVRHVSVRASKPFYLLDSVGPKTSWSHDLYGIALGPSN